MLTSSEAITRGDAGLDSADRIADKPRTYNLQSETFLRIRDLRLHGVPFSHTQIYRLIKQGQFPPPIKLGLNTSAWLRSEIDAWKAARIAERDAAAA